MTARCLQLCQNLITDCCTSAKTSVKQTTTGRTRVCWKNHKPLVVELVAEHIPESCGNQSSDTDMNKHYRLILYAINYDEISIEGQQDCHRTSNAMRRSCCEQVWHCQLGHKFGIAVVVQQLRETAIPNRFSNGVAVMTVHAEIFELCLTEALLMQLTSPNSCWN